MSAYQVTDEGYRLLGRAINSAGHDGLYVWHNDTSYRLGPSFTDEPEPYGNYLGASTQWAIEQLWRANAGSVAYRYSEPETEAQCPDVSTVALMRTPMPEPVTVLKGLDSWRYQSSEPPSFADSLAEAIAASLRDAMIRALPGYDEAPWP